MFYRVVCAMGTSLALTAVLGAQQGDFEEAPVLQASEILRPEVYEGPSHRVRDSVPTYAGANRYVIESDFGRFTADGNALLLERVREVYAIARLREVSKGREYAEALKQAAKSPVNLARDLVNDPVETVAAVPQGVWKFINRAGQGVKEAARKRESSDYEDRRASDLLGVSKFKREWAADLHIDPYSSNQVLQHDLNSVAWTSFAGKATVSALTIGLTGGASIVAGSISFVDSASQALRDMSPLDLRLDNQKRLDAMGVAEADITAFLDHRAYSPSYQTYLVHALEQMDGLKGRGDYLRLAISDAKGEQDAIFFTRTAQLLARLYLNEVPMQRIDSLDGLPVVIGPSGELTVALEWDYAAWTETAVGFAENLRDFASKNKPNPNTRDLPRVLVALSGDATPRFQQELRDRGVALQLRIDPLVLR